MRTILKLQSIIKQIITGMHALGELGFKPVACLAVYRFGLMSGHYRRLFPHNREWRDYLPPSEKPIQVNFPIQIPDAQLLSITMGKKAKMTTLREAAELLDGKFHIFGADDTVQINLKPTPPLAHWTDYELGNAHCGDSDIKLVWEPGRFGWVYLLGRAYILTNDEKYPQHFLKLTKDFVESNPPHLGPHWTSAQEVALRLLSLLFAMRVFSGSSIDTPENYELINAMVIAHAKRIPPTIWYARAQNNNHLLTEALGLFAAGISVSGHPQANSWKKYGWDWFNQAILEQINPDGTYIQHSTNYHRLMLQASLWMLTLSRNAGLDLPASAMKKLAMATRWLCAQLDPVSGKVPNLGHNDGAYIIPLAPGDFADYRPVAQAASRAFLGQCCLPSGPWDEFCAWLGLDTKDCKPEVQLSVTSPAVYRIGDEYSWATLRAAQFDSRPAHADQLHVDLWWQGQNIAMNAGTFSYNISAPWDNALAHTHAHNTITIDNRDQMLRAGKFLWLDWAQAKLLEYTPQRIVAKHNGYRNLGITHQRSIARLDKNHWLIIDSILPDGNKIHIHTANLHWLLPDWQWQLHDTSLSLSSQHGKIDLRINGRLVQPFNLPGLIDVAIIRGGHNLICNQCDTPYLGWVSPTYSVKLPALSFRTIWQGQPPFEIQTEWELSPLRLS